MAHARASRDVDSQVTSRGRTRKSMIETHSCGEVELVHSGLVSPVLVGGHAVEKL